MDTADIRALALRLNGDQAPRVWSLLVTVFGDLAQGKGDRVSGRILRQLMDIIGVKPEAMRVALHRLRKEGWIDSEKEGRNSNYFLTPSGRAQSAAASPSIYAAEPDPSEAWLVMHNPTGLDKDSTAADLWVGANTRISNEAPAEKDVFAMRLDPDVPLPGWISARLCDPQTVAQSQTLAEVLLSLLANQDRIAGLSPADTAALRVLVVHSWRRIILKTPRLPAAVLGDKWAGELCRVRVHQILGLLPKPCLNDMDQGKHRPTPTM